MLIHKVRTWFASRISRTTLAALGLFAATATNGVTGGALVASTEGCSSCDCASPGAFVQVPASRADDVAAVTATGATCAASVTCESNTGGPDASSSGCTAFHVSPSQEGRCRIEVTFTSGAGSVQRDVEFRRFSGCCSGLYPVDGVALVQVPEGAISVASTD